MRFRSQWIAKNFDWLTWLVQRTKKNNKHTWKASGRGREKSPKPKHDTARAVFLSLTHTIFFSSFLLCFFDDYWSFLCREWFLLWKIYYVWTHLFVCSFQSICWHVFISIHSILVCEKASAPFNFVPCYNAYNIASCSLLLIHGFCSFSFEWWMIKRTDPSNVQREREKKTIEQKNWQACQDALLHFNRC